MGRIIGRTRAASRCTQAILPHRRPRIRARSTGGSARAARREEVEARVSGCSLSITLDTSWHENADSRKKLLTHCGGLSTRND